MKIDVVTDEKYSKEESYEILSFIIRAYNYNFNDLGIAKYRFIGKIDNQIVAHAALSERSISINDNKYNVLFLGQVCTKKSLRNKGYGGKIIEYIRNYNFDKKYDLIILNCGEGVLGFYEKSHFSKICSSAKYLRNGKIEIDLDPVLCFILNKRIDLNDLLTKEIFLGEDF